MRVADRFYADGVHTGGLIFIGATQLSNIGSVADAVLTRNAQGDYSLDRTAGAAETLRFAAVFPNLFRPVNEPVDTQQQFGGSLGPIPVAGRPPFLDADQLVPPTTWRAAGIRIEDVVVVYEVGVVDLTSAALVLDRVAYVDITAPAVTSIPIDATALVLTTDADPHLETRVVTTPTLFENDNEVQIAEFEAVLANTGTLKVHGIGIHVSFNYN